MTDDDYSLRKHLTKLSSDDLVKVKELSQINLKGANETAVRELFLAPLVRLLGYSRAGEFQVLHEDSFDVGDWYAMYGRQKIKLDYRFLVWKTGLWLLEAKPGPSPKSDSGRFKPEDVQQAYSYSTHPKIDAPLFAVSNGAVTEIYDRDMEGLDPILTVHQADLLTKIDQLRELLAADQIQFYLKRKLLRRIERVLASEVVLSRPDEFTEAVRRVAYLVRPRVNENFRANAATQKPLPELWDELASGFRADEIIDTFFMQQMCIGLVRTLCARIAASLHGRGDLLFFARLLLEELRPVTIHYNHNVLFLLGVLAERDFVSDYVPSELRQNGLRNIPVRDLFYWWLQQLVTGFAAKPELRMLWLVEGTAGRIAKRLLIVQPAQRQNIERQVAIARYMMAEGHLDRSVIVPAKVMIQTVERMILAALSEFVAEFYDEDRREFKFALARQKYQQLLELEQRLDAEDYAAIIEELGQSWSELMSFDSINKSYDLLAAGALNIFREFPKLSQTIPEAVALEAAKLAALNLSAGQRICEEHGVAFTPFDDGQRREALSRRFSV